MIGNQLTPPRTDTVRAIIVNADDFGRSPGINRGVAAAFEYGIVTSASLMVRWPAAQEAADYARRHPLLSLGLHVDLCEWAYGNDEWYPVYQVVPTADPVAIGGEIERQLELFERLTGRLPTHIDSHQHVHRSEPVRSIVRRLGRLLRVPVRHFSAHVDYCGAFFGQSKYAEPTPHQVSVPGLLEILGSLGAGTTELACHPAAEADWDSPYSHERVLELTTLCDPRVSARLREMRIELRSFHDCADRPPAGAGFATMAANPAFPS